MRPLADRLMGGRALGLMIAALVALALAVGGLLWISAVNNDAIQQSCDATRRALEQLEFAIVTSSEAQGDPVTAAERAGLHAIFDPAYRALDDCAAFSEGTGG